MDDFVGRKNLIETERLQALTQRSNLRGAIQTVSHFGAIAATGAGLYLSWGTLWAVPLFVLHGMLINYLFAAQHEFNHYTAFESRWLNDVFNRITSFVVFYPRTHERWYHFAHHRNTQSWEKDPELLSRGGPYRLGGYLLYLLGITYWSGRWRTMVQHAMGDVPDYFLSDAQRRAVVLEERAYLLGYAAIAVLSLWFQSWAAVTYWLAPMLTTKILHQVQNITEHTGLSHEPDTVHNTRTIRTWPVLRWMAWNMQYHAAHHTFPAVPFHKLPELHEELVERLGYEPPAIGYIEFQRRFIGRLLRGPETKEGVSEVEIPAPPRAA